MSKHVGGEGGREGGLVWAEAPLNEEAAEPFLLLSNCMLGLPALGRGRESRLEA